MQRSVYFLFEISTDWCSVTMARIESKHATNGIGLQTISGWFKKMYIFKLLFIIFVIPRRDSLKFHRNIRGLL